MQHVWAFVKREWMFLGILVAPFIWLAFSWDQLPESIPVHWNVDGSVTSTSSRAMVALYYPLMNVGLYLLFLAIPRIDPFRENFASWSRTYRLIRLVMCGFLGVMFALHARKAIGAEASVRLYEELAILLMLAFLGNYMRTVRPNYFVGIRTPWTLASAEVWKRTHEIGGKLFFYSGIVGAVLVVSMKDIQATWIAFAPTMASALYAVVYSYVEWQRLAKLSQQ